MCPGIGKKYKERLRGAGLNDFSSLIGAEPNELATKILASPKMVKKWQETARYVEATKYNLTLYCGSKWMIYTTLNNIKVGSSVSVMLSGKRVFDKYSQYYQKLIDGGVTLRVLLDKKDDNQIEKVKNFKNKKKIEPLAIRFCQHESHETCRRIIVDDCFALDGRKMLPYDRADPSYIGTIYIRPDCINLLRENFNAMGTI